MMIKYGKRKWLKMEKENDAYSRYVVDTRVNER